MNYLFDARTLSHYVVNRCTVMGQPISNLQLQKILYFLQFFYCRANKGGALLFPEPFYAWPYGPVIPDVYEEFSEFGGRAIEKSFTVELCCDQHVKDFLDEGIDTLREKSPWYLVRISHAQGLPWSLIYRDGDGYKDIIPNSLIIKAACAGVA